jgi:hypothetical protein
VLCHTLAKNHRYCFQHDFWQSAHPAEAVCHSAPRTSVKTFSHTRQQLNQPQIQPKAEDKRPIKLRLYKKKATANPKLKISPLPTETHPHRVEDTFLSRLGSKVN